MTPGKETLFDANDLLPQLRELATAAGLDVPSLTVALRCDDPTRLHIDDRHRIILVDKKDRPCEWRVPCLSELFRGNKTPPRLEQYPPEYTPVFYFTEHHMLTADSATGGKLRDREMEEIYRSIRRRPDGRSLGPVHDFLWQVAATVLALRPLSQAEHEEIFGRLARSCSNFAFGATSRNYFTQVRANVARL